MSELAGIMADFHFFDDFHGLHQYWASAYKGAGRRGLGVGWVVAKAKTKKQGDTMVEFRVSMMSTCTHKGLIFHYKA